MPQPALFRTVVCVFLQNEEGHICLFERTGTETSVGVFVVGGGSVDEGENLHQAAVREMKEELGITINPAHLEFVGVFDRTISTGPGRQAQFYFRATQWKGTPTNAEPHKHGNPQWYALDNLPEKLHAWDKMIVENNFAPKLYVIP